ncbi:MAG: hypothetical protein KC420_20300 [Myxococcales bacterium]|nr:hypothetical protein [Myxococcales bacterium]MCB9566172.1 hypothetical protein [Myxococcales bacterium]MCB9705834.1 hypothetical protein [Myxococcales bacterium]
MRPSARLSLLAALLAAACAPREPRALAHASDRLAREVRRGDRQAVTGMVVPVARPRVDLERLEGEGARSWAKALSKPVEVRAEATLFVAADRPVEIVQGERGWLFAEDPFDRWDQSTPRATLRTLVRASQERRWDVLLGLAPRRYRVGLSVADLERAWTEGEHAEALRNARERLRAHLADPIRVDTHEAALDLGEGRFARLEREGDRWVVVDF